MSPTRATSISVEEFEALPASVQKKCFSSLERLRISQQHHIDERRKQMHKRSWRSPPSPITNSVRPATSQGLRGSSNATDSSFHRFPLLTTKQKHISDEQARWFLNLPEKIRRQQFSREEQIKLMVHCKRALEFTSPELASDAYRRCCSEPKYRSRMSLLSKDRPSTSAGVGFDINRSFLDTDAASVRTTETSNAEMKIFKLYSRTIPPDVTDNDKLNADAPLASPPEPAKLKTTAPVPQKRRPFRRLSLIPLPLPPPTLAPPLSPLLSSPSISRRGSLRPISVTAALSARLSRPYMDLFSPGELPDAETNSPSRPYHDQDIRMQLRRTLLSTEKFDEALEFGFKKDDGPTAIVPHTTFDFPFQHPSPCDDDEDDSYPFPSYLYLEDEAEDAEENEDTISIDTASPRTPTPMTEDFLPSSNRKPPSVDSAIGISHPIYQAPTLRPITSLAESVGSPREWTLHMTLTRADLAQPSPSSSVSGGSLEVQRARKLSAEDMLYSVQRQQTSGVEIETQDPLALQKLEVCEDDTGAQGAFAVGRQGRASKNLKKVWRKIRGSGST